MWLELDPPLVPKSFLLYLLVVSVDLVSLIEKMKKLMVMKMRMLMKKKMTKVKKKED